MKKEAKKKAAKAEAAPMNPRQRNQASRIASLPGASRPERKRRREGSQPLRACAC